MRPLMPRTSHRPVDAAVARQMPILKPIGRYSIEGCDVTRKMLCANTVASDQPRTRATAEGSPKAAHTNAKAAISKSPFWRITLHEYSFHIPWAARVDN